MKCPLFTIHLQYSQLITENSVLNRGAVTTETNNEDDTSPPDSVTIYIFKIEREFTRELMSLYGHSFNNIGSYQNITYGDLVYQ